MLSSAFLTKKNLDPATPLTMTFDEAASVSRFELQGSGFRLILSSF